MANQPEDRIVGAILLDLEQQAREVGGPWMGQPYGGVVLIDGNVDLYLLARAVIAEIKENPL
jgi:hypothetical protein